MRKENNIVSALLWFFLLASIAMTLLWIFIENEDQINVISKISIYCYLGLGITLTIQSVTLIKNNNKNSKKQ